MQGLLLPPPAAVVATAALRTAGLRTAAAVAAAAHLRRLQHPRWWLRVDVVADGEGTQKRRHRRGQPGHCCVGRWTHHGQWEDVSHRQHQLPEQQRQQWGLSLSA